MNPKQKTEPYFLTVVGTKDFF